MTMHAGLCIGNKFTSDSSDRAGIGAGAGAFASPFDVLEVPDALLKGEGRIRLTFSCISQGSC